MKESDSCSSLSLEMSSAVSYKDRHRIWSSHKDSLAEEVNGTREIFLEQLADSSSRATIRETSADSRALRAKESSPGKLKDEQSWDRWEEQSLFTMLSILKGVNRVPALDYVIREEEHKKGDEYPTFVVEDCNEP